MAFLQLPQGPDNEWIREGLKYLAIFFFVVLPLIKSIVESRKQEAEKKRKLERSEQTPETADESIEPVATEEADGRKAWEALRRGETAAAPPPAPPPLPISVAQSRVPKAVPLFDLEELRPKMASDENLELERRSDEEGVAEAEIARRERDAVRAETQASLAEVQAERFEEDYAALQRSAAALSTQAPPAEITSAARAARPVAPRPRRWKRRADLRAAFVASEVLGQPLALRRDGQQPWT